MTVSSQVIALSCFFLISSSAVEAASKRLNSKGELRVGGKRMDEMPKLLSRSNMIYLYLELKRRQN